MLNVTHSHPRHPHSRHPRRYLHCHLSHSTPRRRSLSQPSPSSVSSIAELTSTTPSSLPIPLPPSVDLPSEEEEDDDDPLPSTTHSAPFTLKETSGESSDDEVDDDEEEDDDSCSSVSSSSTGSTPTPPVKAAQVVVGKRAVVSCHVTGGSGSAGEKVTSVVHRKVVRPSLRQFKVSSHYYTPLKTKKLTQPITTDELPNDAQSTIAPPPTLPLIPSVDCTSTSPSTPRSSSLTRYALLVAILRRSDGRDKLVKTAYYASNELRFLTHSIVTKLSSHRGVAALVSQLSLGEGVWSRLALMAVACCRRLDVGLERFGEVMGSARQLLRFGRWVYDIESLHEAWNEWKEVRSSGASLSSSLIPLLELINAFLSLLIDLFDDLEWLSEQSILPSSLSPLAGAGSAFLWLLTVCIDVPLTVWVVWGMKKGDEWRSEMLSLVKYGGDGVYAASLVGGVMGWTMNEGLAQGGGLLSAVTSLYKLSRSQRLHRMVL